MSLYSDLTEILTPYANKIKEIIGNKVDLPSNGYGASGKVLRSTGTGTEWAAVGQPTDTQTADAVSDWLNEHPEVTTTVQDGSITEAKLSDALKGSLKDYVTPQMFGAACDGQTDDTLAVQRMVDYAITNNKDALIPSAATVKVTSEIIINGNNFGLFVGGKIYAPNSNAVRIIGSRNRIIGTSGRISGGGSGVGILIGGEDKTNSCNFNHILNLLVENFDTGIQVYNHQLQSMPVWFNKIGFVNFDNCRAGLEFVGYANANNATNLTFYRCGTNNVTGGAIVFRSVDGQYPIENTISQIFHHGSTNAVTLNIEKIQYSSFAGIVCEQGGTSAKGLRVTSNATSNNQFLSLRNVSGVDELPDNFYETNMLMTGSSLRLNTFKAKTNTVVEGGILVSTMSTVKRFIRTQIKEGTVVTLMTPQLNKKAAYRIKCLSTSQTGVQSLQNYAEALIVTKGLGGTPVLVKTEGTKEITIDSDSNVTISVGSNGTGTEKGSIYLEIEEIFANTTAADIQHYAVGEGFITY